MPASVTTGPARSNNVSRAKVWTYRGSLQGSRKLWILCGGAQHQRVPGTGKTRLQPECLNCFKNHPSWSFQCQYRKEESAMIEEWRRNMPRTHKEAALRWGNITGKSTHTKDATQTRRKNGRHRAPREPPISSAAGSQRRGRSPRKYLRICTSQGHGDTT
ncbi:hypothetical protein BJX65DRAFT_245934 [Aspergillus insuetus]